MTETPNSVASPIYDGLVTEHLNAGQWTPADLKPTYDLLERIEWSYVLVWDKDAEADA